MAISAVVAAVGVGVSAVGTVMNMGAASKAASANEDIANQQQQANQLQMKAMETDARRKQLQVVRDAQVARANSTSTAVSQNAQLGSGLQGGYGQISGEENTNELGIYQNLEYGRKQFAINSAISNDRISLAQASGEAGWGSGLMSLGGSIFNAYGATNRLSQVPWTRTS